MKRKRGQQTRREQIEEADKIYDWLIFQRGLAGDLIRASLKFVSNRQEVADVRLDLYMIARDLAAAATPGTWNALWKDYQRHFVSDQEKQLFFTKLRELTRWIASMALISALQTRKPNVNAKTKFPWDSSLLPSRIGPWVVRLATLHPGILEYFLPRFFLHISDCLLQGSTYRRALLILSAVPEFGWSAEKHTKRLIDLKEIQESEDASEVETVKKFIRDLRCRHKKRLLTQQAKPVQGTSSARKAAT
jgi:hypothetical protein